MRALPILLFAVAIAAGCTADNTDLADASVSSDLATLPLGVDLATNANDDAATATDGGVTDASPADAGDAGRGCVPKDFPCGNCGTMSLFCDADGGTHMTGCQGQGVCKPGSTQPFGNCGIQTCGATCKWDMVAKKPGAQCLDGTSQTCKSSDPFCHVTGHQQCDRSSCNWGSCLCL